jgi:hypothetical protein
MDDDVRAFGMDLGRKAIERDWSAVHRLLAPWVRATCTVDDIRTFFEDEYRSTLEENEAEGMQYPEHPEPELGGNGFTTATDLREPISFAGDKVRAIAPELTDDNMRYWLKLQLRCSEEQTDELDFDFFCEVWMAVVDTPEGLRVGYWSQGAY